jgi:putative DNA methylase
MNHPVISPKTLIEVALPLDAINVASAREKSIRHGHPSTLHLWWARRPLAAARAVIFSQLVHDPEDLWRCQNPGVEPNKQVKGHWTKSRARLFSIIEDLVKWENTTDEQVLEKAREEIRRSWRESCELNKDHPLAKDLFDPEQMPRLHDPFAGGGTIPLEAQRLGLDSYATDLNPVAVLINKAMIEIPPRFAGMPAVNPKSCSGYGLGVKLWRGAEGIAEDFEYYARVVLEQAKDQIGKFYAPVSLPKALGGGTAQVINWIWCRTVQSPNPAAGGKHTPLIKSFKLASQGDGEIWLVPHVSKDGSLHYKIGNQENATSTGTIGRNGATCVYTNSPIPLTYIRAEGLAGRIGHRLVAIVVQGRNGKTFLSGDDYVAPDIPGDAIDLTDIDILHWSGCTNVVVYGMKTFLSLFNPRQRLALTTFCRLVRDVKTLIIADAEKSQPQMSSQAREEYSKAIAAYLACAIGRAADYWNSLTSWESGGGFVAHAFTKHALPMIWDYAEVNPLEDCGGSWESAIGWIARVIRMLPADRDASTAVQHDATKPWEFVRPEIISTDPPYYDNVPYANLSDFFYLWMRQSLRDVYPDIFSTIQTPKHDELVASHSLYDSIDDAMNHFTSGMTAALANIKRASHPSFPITIYYAFKQSDSDENATSSSGWESFLDSVVRSGLAVVGTWPMRTERSARGRAIGSNALASSVILACRKRQPDAASISRREFIRELNATLPIALDAMTRESEGLHSPVAPVDLSQAIIGPGMSVFSRYSAVLEADGTPMTVRTALQLINRFLVEDDFDADTQFCLHWFEQFGWETGKFGEADTLARAKGTSVDGVKHAGVLHAAGGNVRLLKWAEYQSVWDPQSDHRLPIWEVLHQLIRVFNTEGETGAAAVFAAVQSKAEAARQLAYRLYTLCERKNWAEDARAYNEVVTSWSSIESVAAKEPTLKQRELFE